MGSGNFRTFCVSRDININPNSTDVVVMRLVGRNRRVLELGCGAGHMSEALRGQECNVVGIEINPEAAERASASCERVIVADLDYMDFDQELGSDRFDVIVAADVLEHLKDPMSVLHNIKKFLTPSGYLVTSIPNIAHMSVRLALLSGKFPYGESGLLDRTHLRFFTRESAEKLLDEAGLVVGHCERVVSIPDPAKFEVSCDPPGFRQWQEVPFFHDPAKFEVPYELQAVAPAVLESICRDPEALTYQFVFVGYAVPQPSLVFVQERMRQFANEAENARNDVANLSLQLDQVKRQHELESRSLAEQAASAESGRIALESRVNTLLQEVRSLLGRVAQLEALNADGEREIQSLRHRDTQKEKHIAELHEVNESDLRQTAELRSHVEQQKQRIGGLTAQVEALLAREKDLREMLLEAHDQLLRRDEEIAAAVPASLPLAQTTASAVGPFAPQTLPGKYLQYQQLLQRIRELVRDADVKSCNVLVISKGDEDLLRLGFCTGSHFPQGLSGSYAGHHPENGAAAIKHLEELRERGAQFLLIPQTSLWWLDHYTDFRDYLNQHFSRRIDQPDICLLFDLAGSKEKIEAGEAVIESSEKQSIEVTGSPARNPSTLEPRPFGVNVSGHITSEKGVGEAVRGQIRSFTALNVPIVLNDYADNSAVNMDEEFSTFSEDNPYSVNLIHLNADSLKYFVEATPKEYFLNRYNIGYWAWETSVFPKEWWDRFQLLDEIWVGSDFVMDAISRVSPIPVIKVLLAVPDRLSVSSLSRAHFGLPKSAFIFLFVFDYMSVAQRKNPFGLVQAFRNAFSKRDDVLLVLKCVHSERHPDDTNELKRACNGANIKIIDGVLSRKELTSLMKAADCYVSLHRSEGFGLTIAEAMSFEKPVIATAFSGNMEFMNPANSYLVKYKLIDINQDYGPYRGGIWAEPDLDHATELMRRVFKNRNEAQEVGRRARRDVLKALSEPRAGALMRNRLLRLAELGKIAPPATEYQGRVQAELRKNGFYHELVSRIRHIVETNIPRDSCLLVVSKGDDELVEFDARSALHFPQSLDGRYAGHHPANSIDAIQQLESLKRKGCQYFLFPQTAFWWLDYYKELQSHLQNQYRRVWNDPDCIIYQLSERDTRLRKRARSRRDARIRAR